MANATAGCSPSAWAGGSLQNAVAADAQYEGILRVTAFLAAIWGFGRILTALRLPPTLGALGAGMLLGPEGLNFVPFARVGAGSDIWRLAGNLGITLLIFEFGSSIDFGRLRQVRVSSTLVAVSTTLMPICCALGLTALRSWGDGHFLPAGLAAGVALAPTSPVAMRALEEEELLKSLPGQTALVATFSGITISLVALAVLRSVAASGEIDVGLDILLPLVASILFVLFGGLLARSVFPRVLNPRLERVARVGRVSIQPRDEIHLFCMIATLSFFAYITSTSLFGTHLLGAFVAGMCFIGVHRSRQVWRVQLKRIRAWCVRIFFAATIGFAIPIRLMGTPSLFAWGCVFGAVAGVFAKLTPCLVIPLRDAADTPVRALRRHPRAAPRRPAPPRAASSLCRAAMARLVHSRARPPPAPR